MHQPPAQQQQQQDCTQFYQALTFPNAEWPTSLLPLYSLLRVFLSSDAKNILPKSNRRQHSSRRTRDLSNSRGLTTLFVGASKQATMQIWWIDREILVQWDYNTFCCTPSARFKGEEIGNKTRISFPDSFKILGRHSIAVTTKNSPSLGQGCYISLLHLKRKENGNAEQRTQEEHLIEVGMTSEIPPFGGD